MCIRNAVEMVIMLKKVILYFRKIETGILSIQKILFWNSYFYSKKVQLVLLGTVEPKRSH